MDHKKKSTQAGATGSPDLRDSNFKVPEANPKKDSSGPQPMASKIITFFNLPSKARNDIYRRVLTVAHPVYLFQEKDSRVETFAPERPPQWLALLYVNRQMKSEASAALYGSNKFALVDESRPHAGLLQAFLSCVGSVNASSLSHLSINFPVPEGHPEGFKLREDSLHTLNLLQKACTGLMTLELRVSSRKLNSLTDTDHNNSQTLREALSQLDVRLKAISSLHNVVIRANGGIPIPAVMECMQSLSWVVKPTYGDQW